MYFDQIASEQIYVWETFGAKKYRELFDADTIDSLNGFHHGKRWLDVMVTAWKEDIANGNLLVEELAAEYPAFVVKKVRS